MKFIIGIFLLLCTTASGQPDTFFAKYSYQIFGYTLTNATAGEIKMAAGTGFFIRENDHLLFVTSKHVLSGCDSIKDPSHPDVVNVFLHDSAGNMTSLLPIDIRLVKQNSKCLPMKDDPDIVVIDINRKLLKDTVYSLEAFIKPRFNNISDILFYGYPVRGYSERYIEFHPTKTVMHSPNYRLYSGVVENGKVIDSLNYGLTSTEITFNSSYKGFSGSPVFLRNDSTDWRLMGICIGYTIDEAKKETYIIIAKSEMISKSDKYFQN